MVLACQPGTNINEGCWGADQTGAGTKTCPDAWGQSKCWPDSKSTVASEFLMDNNCSQ